MCLAVPGKIVSIDEGSNPKMAKVNFGGVLKEVCLEFVPEAKVNDYAVVHVGFALSIVDEKEAEETLKMFKEMDKLADEEDKKICHKNSKTQKRHKKFSGI